MIETDVFKGVIHYLNMEDVISLKSSCDLFSGPLYSKEIKLHIRKLIFIVFGFAHKHRDCQRALATNIGTITLTSQKIKLRILCAT